MMIDPGQRARMIDYMETHAPARSRELAAIGVAATAISRAVSDGAIVRIGRGLYQLPDSELDLHSALIEIAKRAPNFAAVARSSNKSPKINTLIHSGIARTHRQQRNRRRC